MRVKTDWGFRGHFLLAWIVFVCAGAVFGTTIYVDDNAPNDPGPGDPAISDPFEGGTVEHPFDAIQQAIDVAVGGDTVLVANGTYTGTGNRDIDFRGKAITVKSVNGAATCMIDCQAGTTQDQWHRGFVFDEGEQTGSILDGLTISGGNHNKGSALYVTAASLPVIQNCILVQDAQAAIHVEQSRCRIVSCRFENLSGTGIRGDAATLMIRFCTFVNNALCIANWGEPCLQVIRDCRFTANDTVISLNGELRIANCIFERNRGTVIDGYSGTNNKPIAVFNSGFYGNNNSRSINYLSSVAELIYGTPSQFVNCVFSGNYTTTGSRVSTLHLSDSAQFVNCTFYGNGIDPTRQSLNPIASIWHFGYNPPTLRNCIFWNEYQPIHSETGSKFPASNCLLENRGMVNGVNNLTADPLFIDPDGPDRIPGTADDNLRVYLDSPCTDGGDNNFQPTDDLDVDNDGWYGELVPRDLDGDPRRVVDPRKAEGSYPIIDIGAYENPKYSVCVNPRFLTVSEGSTGTFDVFLERVPQQTVEVHIGRGPADPDLRIEGAETLVFTPTNYLTPQRVVIRADEDDDRNQGAGVFVLSAAGYNSNRVVVKERENEPDPTNCLYVDADSTGADSGMSWSDAFRSLQSALEFCRRDPNLFSEVRIAQGTYCPAGPNGDRTMAFNLVSFVALRGGYAGFGEPDPDARDISKYVTVLSGDLNDNDGPTVSLEKDTDNSYRVVVADRFVQNAELEGLTITGARHSAPPYYTPSGGGLVSEGQIRLTRCLVTRNANVGLCSTYQIEMNECGVYDNLGSTVNIYSNYGRTSTISRCTFSGNRGPYLGGIRYGIVRHCVFFNNRSDGTASYLGIGADSNTEITHCIFWGNGDGSRVHQIGWNDNEPPAISYSCIQGWVNDLPAPGILSKDPLFVDGYNQVPELRDFHLKQGSPCIDAGDPTADYSLEPQPNGGRIDIGLYGNTPEATVAVDSDHNGYADSLENLWGLDPFSNDGDGDGLGDVFEIGYDGNSTQYNPYNPKTKTGTDLNAASSDTDGDWLSDSHEIDLYKTNPLNDDSDADGLRDDAEVNGYRTDPLNPDSDGDGMPDGWEVRYGLNPKEDDGNQDRDGDGYSNRTEYQLNSRPDDPTSIPQQALIFVDDDAPLDPGPGNPAVSDPLENGKAEHPFDSIQQAIDAAEAGMTVVVQDGTYTGVGNRNISFHGKGITVRSANGPDRCIVDCQQSGRGFVFTSGETISSVLDGLTITRGSVGNGAGIYCKGASPSILNCILTANGFSGSGQGAGMYLEDSSAQIVGCAVTDNHGGTFDNAGGIYAYKGSLTVLYCTVTDNSGAGVRLHGTYGSHLTVIGCDILRNQGSGVFAYDCGLILTDCVIAQNVTGPPANSWGGGVMIDSGDMGGNRARIERCQILDNKSPWGGGILTVNGPYVDVFNTLVSGNTAIEQGGGVYIWNRSVARMINCTVTNNHGPLGPGILEEGATSTLSLINTIVWGNGPGWGNPAKDQVTLSYTNPYTSTFSAQGCAIQGGRDGVVSSDSKWIISWKDGNIGTGSQFVNPSLGDFHLRAGSSCIDAGVPEVELDGLTDLDSGPRIAGPRVDIGADEYDFRESALEISDTVVTLESYPHSPLAEPKNVSIRNNGNRAFSWTIQPHEACSWLSVEPAAGTLAQNQSCTIALKANGSHLTPNTYGCTLIVSAEGVANLPQEVGVEFHAAVWTDPATGYGGGSGIESDPYRIWTGEHFQQIGLRPGDWDKHFVLMADIDLGYWDGHKGRPALPLVGANGAEPGFGGSFDGGGHQIRHLTLQDMSQDFAGLFGRIGESGKVANLHLVDLFVEGREIVGGVAGLNEGTLVNCTASGSVLGLVGVGGLAGQNNGMIQGCAGSCTVEGFGYYVGGLVGNNSWGSILQSSTAGSVKGDSMAGGLAGKNQAMISDSYSLCTVVGRLQVGGLVGWNRNGVIDRCFAAARAWATEDREGGLVGFNDQQGKVQWSFWDTTFSGIMESDGGEGMTTAQMKMRSTFSDAGWDFVGANDEGTEDAWRMCVDGVDYPRISRTYSILGDYDCPDGIDLEDGLYLALRWMATTPEGCGSADGNGDGQIGLADLALLSGHWLADRQQALVGYWTLDRTLQSAVGSGISRPVGDPAFAAATEARVGSGAIDLDGNDALITRGLEPIAGTAARTTTAWIRTRFTIGPIVYWGRKDAAGGRWEMRINEMGQLCLSTGGGEIRGTSRINTDEWVHVAAALPAGSGAVDDIRLYVNGLPETTTIISGQIDTIRDPEIRIGMDDTGRYFTGFLDDIRVYDRALTAEEIAALAGP